MHYYYIAYIRPHLEYASIFYDSISDEKSSQIEKIQYDKKFSWEILEVCA